MCNIGGGAECMLSEPELCLITRDLQKYHVIITPLLYHKFEGIFLPEYTSYLFVMFWIVFQGF